jgi:uncharacterized damage-inducible protein DinB
MWQEISGEVLPMDALDLLRTQVANADRITRQVFDPVTPEQATWRLADSKANTIGATFMHAYFSEDQMVHTALGAPLIFESEGWRERVGYDHGTVWQFTGRHEPELLRTYADAVSRATSEYLSTLSPTQLEEEIDTPRGRQPRVNRLVVYLVNHKFQHAGEMAALLGCQGEQGLPF